MKFALVGTLVAAGICQTASASLILVSPVAVSGAGLGTVATILTVQNTTSEAGCVGFTSSNTGSSFSGGTCTGSSSDVKTGAGQIGPQPLSAAGSPVDASNFAIVFNADQVAGGPITLTELTASFYSPTGTLLYQTSGFSCPGLTSCTFPNTFSGVGTSGFVFALDASQAAAATSAGAFSSQNNIVGLSAALSGSTGGPDTFSLGAIQGTNGVVTPEPQSLVLALSGGVLLIGGRFLTRKQTPL